MKTSLQHKQEFIPMTQENSVSLVEDDKSCSLLPENIDQDLWQAYDELKKSCSVQAFSKDQVSFFKKKINKDRVISNVLVPLMMLSAAFSIMALLIFFIPLLAGMSPPPLSFMVGGLLLGATSYTCYKWEDTLEMKIDKTEVWLASRNTLSSKEKEKVLYLLTPLLTSEHLSLQTKDVLWLVHDLAQQQEGLSSSWEDVKVDLHRLSQSHREKEAVNDMKRLRLEHEALKRQIVGKSSPFQM